MIREKKWIKNNKNYNKINTYSNKSKNVFTRAKCMNERMGQNTKVTKFDIL